MKQEIENLLTENKFLVLNPTIDDIEDKNLADFFRVWLASNNFTSLPTYELYKTSQFQVFFDNLAVLDFDPRSHRFKIIEMGKNVIEVLGSEILDQYWDSLPGSDEGQARMSWATENKLPYYVGWPVYNWAQEDMKNYSAIICPLFDEDDEVDKLVFAFAWQK